MSNSPSKLIIGIVTILIGLAIAGAVYWTWPDTATPSTSQQSTTVKPMVKSKASLSTLKEFDRYGDWPIGVVTLSPDRGNPFVSKR